MLQFRNRLLASTVIAGLAVAAPTFASAQEQPTETAPPADQRSVADQAPATSSQAASDDASEVESVVVTGSRIRRSEYNSPDPIQVITSENAGLKGVADTAGMLQSSTVAAGSPQVNTIISSAFVTDGGPGASTISLRGLGANRTLVLLNGRRAGPAGTRGAVSAFDLNVIPESSIDRIEILKDGASSIYGSDAVAGVVNIITKTNLDGLEMDAFGSQPFEKGGEQYRFSAAWGKTFDRGHASVSFDYYRQNELKVGDRDFAFCNNTYTRSAATGRRNDYFDPRTGKFTCRDVLWGDIFLYDYTSGSTNVPPGALLQYDATGQLGQLVPGTILQTPPPGNPDGWLTAPANWFLVNYDRPTRGVTNGMHPFVKESSLIPQNDRATVYAEGAYDLGGGVEAYGEVLLNRRETKTNGFRQFWTYLYSYDFGDPFSAGFGGAFIFSPTAITDHFDASQRVDYARVVGGLRGRFNGTPILNNWDWDLYFQYSKSDGAYSQDVILKDAVDSAELRTGSCVGSTLPVSGKPCMDINWLNPDFLAGNLTAAERAYLFDKETGHTDYTQQTVEGSMSGDLFNLPAGPVGAAIGFQMRKDEIRDTPGDITLSNNSWGLTGAGITAGEDQTRELFGELSIPVIKGMPFMEDVSLSASGRYTDVDSYGSNSTYKLGLNWKINSALRFRATHGTSFRAPALFELYLADQTSFLGQRSIDPCINWATALANGQIQQRVADNCAADGIPGNYTGAGSSATIITGGGAGILKAEESKATTLGLIWTPSFTNLSVALDYFEIEVENEVTQLGAGNIVGLCYNSQTFPTDPLCGLFSRNPATHLVTTVHDSYINIADQMNRGLDLTARYRHEFDFGDLTINTQMTWQIEDKIALFANNTVDNNGFIGDPDWVGNTSVQFDRGDWTLFWGIDMIGKSSDAERNPDTGTVGGQPSLFKVQAEFTAYHSFSVRRRYDDWTLLFGIANAFDEAPPNVTAAGVSSGTTGDAVLGSQYDYFGRRLFLNVTKRF